MSLSVIHNITDPRSGRILSITRSGDEVTIEIVDRKGSSQAITIPRDDWKEVTR